MDFPSPANYDSADELAAAVATRLRSLPLAGPSRGITVDVREWAAASGVDLTDDDLLDAYNRATEEASTELPRQLSQLARDDTGREALVALLNRTGTSDHVRLAILDALEPVAEELDPDELARVNLRQRPAVLPRALRVLAATNSTGALFALEKLFAGSDRAGADAERLAHDLWQTSAAGAAVRAALEENSLSWVAGLPPDQVLRAVLALSSDQQARFAAIDPDRQLREFGPPAIALEAELRQLGQTSSGLGAYEMRLRDELFEFALLSGVPDADDVQSRARENLFRRDDLEDVADLAPALPAPILIDYARRALSRENRRKRPERACLALHAVATRESVARIAIREHAIQCLSEEQPELRFEAARLLAVDESDLSADLRARLAEAYDGLPGGLQRRLAPVLRSVVGAAETPIHFDSFLRWTLSGSDEEQEARLRALLQRWAGERDMVSDDAARFVTTFGEGITRVTGEVKDDLLDELIEVSMSWLRAQGGRIKAPIEALLGWTEFRRAVATRAPGVIERLKADQARGLLTEVTRADDGIYPEIVAELAGVSMSEDLERRILLRVLLDAIQRDPIGATRAVEATTEEGAIRLLASGLLAERAIKDRIEELHNAIAIGAPEALLRQRETVLGAIEVAEQAATGNPRLLELLGDIRRAIGTVADQKHAHSEPGQSASGPGNAQAVSAPPPEAVVSWRLETAERFPGMLEVVDQGRQPLAFASDLSSHGAEVVELLSDLDRRVHSARVAPVADREHYRLDLTGLLESIVDSGLVAAAGDAEGGATLARHEELGDAGADLVARLEGGRAQLREMFFAYWSSRSTASGSASGTRAAIDAAIERAAASPGEPATISMLEEAIQASSEDDVLRATKSLDAGTARAAWKAARALIELDLRSLREAREEEASKERTSGAQVAQKLDLPLRAIERLMFSYFRLRAQLGEAGWRPAEDRYSLGTVIPRRRIDPARHEVRGDRASADEFVIRSLGIAYRGAVVSRAVLEPLEEGQHDESSSVATE